MENSLPFEYGFFYRPVQVKIDPLTLEDAEKIKNEIQRGIQMDMDYASYSNNGYGQLTGSITRAVDENRFFHPVGFIESQQMVVCDVMMKASERISGFQYLNQSMQYQNAELYKTDVSLGRVKINVHVFIKYFEKVL